MFFASFFIVYYLVASVAFRFRDVDFLARVLAGGGAVVAVFTIIESRTGYNVFAHLHSVMPFLHNTHHGPTLTRGGRLRAIASAQHPIALGAALVMLAPLAIHRAYLHKQFRWWAVCALLVLGALATVSRTAVVMLGVIILVYLLLRPTYVKRLWPLALPASGRRPRRSARDAWNTEGLALPEGRAGRAAAGCNRSAAADSRRSVRRFVMSGNRIQFSARASGRA